MASGSGGARSSTSGVEHEETALDSLQFGEDIRHLIAAPPENANSFTALLELPPSQAMELLHSPDSHHKSYQNLTFPTNSGLIERAARFSVFAHNLNSSSNNTKNENHNPADTSSNNSSANLVSVAAKIVKSEPETESSSQMLGSDPTVEDNQRPLGKRKERERKVNKGSTKKSKTPANDSSLPYVHVRARRGQATDSHSLAERARREKINARMKLLQELVPGCNKISGTALVLDEIINHVQSLQRQVEFLSMRLAAVSPRIDINLDSILAADGGSLMDSNFPSMVMPLMWPEVQVNANREQYQQQQWLLDGVHQPVWRTEEDSHNNFITPENSLLSYDSSANSASLHSNQLKMEEL